MEEEFYREKGFYEKIAIGVFYALLIGLIIFLMVAPREIEEVDGQYRVINPIQPEFMVFGGIIFIFCVLVFSLIAMSNSNKIHAEWNHTKLIKGTCQQGMKKGEPIKIYVEKIVPFAKLPPEEKKSTLNFLSDNLSNLRETSNIELIERLLNRSKRIKKELTGKKITTEDFKDKIEKAREEIKKEILKIKKIVKENAEKEPEEKINVNQISEEEEKLLVQNSEFITLFEKFREYDYKKLKKLIKNEDEDFKKFTRLVGSKLANMFSWSSLVGSIDGDGGYEVDGFLVDLFDHNLYRGLVRNMVIHRAISYLKSDFSPDVLQKLDKLDLGEVSISLIIAKREMTFENFPKLPFKSIIMISREDINSSLHYIIGDEDEIYGYDVPCDTAYVHTALFGFSKFDRPVLCLLHAYGKDEGLFQSISEADKINEIMKDIMLAEINDLEAKRKLHDHKIDASVRYAMELEETVEVTMKDTKAIRHEYVEEELKRMRTKENYEGEEYSPAPLWLKVIIFLVVLGIVIFSILLFMTKGDLSQLFAPSEENSLQSIKIFYRWLLLQ